MTKKKATETPKKKPVCEYHLHEGKVENSHTCQYCGKSFCDQHIKAKVPGKPDFDSTSPSAQKLLAEQHIPGGHPCPDYFDFMNKKIESEVSQYRQSLNEIIRSKPIHREPSYFKTVHDDRGWSTTTYKKSHKTAYIIVTIVIIAVAFFIYYGDSSGLLNSIAANFSAGLNNSPIYNGTLANDIQQITTNPSGVVNAIYGKPNITISELERLIHDGINAQRRNNGLSDINFDDRLSVIARAHSQDMADRGYFEHDTPEGCDFFCRYENAGYNCAITIGNTIYQGGENIFQNNLYNTINYINGMPVSYDWNTQEDLASSTVNGWMNSPGHRQNILTSYWRNEGMGVAISSDDKVYVTQDFC